MRIALFHTTLPVAGRKPGGVDVAVHRLANALAEEGGDDVTVLSVGPAPPDARYAHRRLFPRAPWLATSKFGRWVLVPLLLNLVRVDADVLHLHGDDWFFVRRRLPTVRTFHGSAAREASTATSLKRRIAYRLIGPLELVARRWCTLTLAIGADAARRFRADALVSNGVDTTRFSTGQKDATPTALFVGTWDGRKRGWFAQRSFVEHVVPAVPDARLVMVSDRADPHPSVEHLVTPTESGLAQVFASAWVLLHPSLYEGFGIPCVEALACGTQVVATPNEGVADVLADAACAQLVSDERFGEALVEALTQPQRLARCARSGPAVAAAYDIRAVARQHRSQYDRALTRWESARRPARH